MSHIADMGPTLDPHTQILYNRVLVQLGLCAFSLGLIQETVNALTDIVSSGGRLRELIGQGISKMPLNEKEERRRLVPHHMFINTELVEAVHLIGAMLLEVPNIVAEQFDATKKQATKFFRKNFEVYKNFYGPPETSRDIIMVAGKALQQGNWKACYDYLMSVNIWNKLTQVTAEAQKNLLAKVKEQAFKCYIFIYQNSYDSLDIDQLASKFDITKDYIHSFVSKMVFSKELKAYLDVDSNCLMFERDGHTRLENMALTLSDKLAGFLQNNERIMDSKYGNYGFNDKDIAEGIVKKRNITKKKLNVVSKDKKKGKGKKN
jgi:translation initiation factor 3 subunit C